MMLIGNRSKTNILSLSISKFLLLGFDGSFTRSYNSPDPNTATEAQNIFNFGISLCSRLSTEDAIKTTKKE